MTRRPVFTGRFQKDVKRAERRGKDMRKLEAVASALLEGSPLDPLRRDHALVGDFKGCRECHIEPDWLLVYSLGPDFVRFERTGTHADLFE